MKSVQEIEEELKLKITQAVVPIQTKRPVDATLVRGLVTTAGELATTLKGRDMMPRTVLNELYVLIQILRAEAPHGEADLLNGTADQLEHTFALILRGETPADRHPGVPRVV